MNSAIIHRLTVPRPSRDSRGRKWETELAGAEADRAIANRHRDPEGYECWQAEFIELWMAQRSAKPWLTGGTDPAV